MMLRTIFFLSMMALCAQGQSTLVPNYYCDESNDTVEFTLSPSTHSGWDPMSNCFLQQCLLSANINDSCRSTTAPCYDYRTYDNTSFCAPGILCSILETCNNTNYSCSSPDFVCVVNSCCSQPTICIPIAWTNFCILAASTTTMTTTTETVSTTSRSTTTTTVSTSTSSTSTSSSTSTTSTGSTTSTKITSTTTSAATTASTLSTSTTSYNCNSPKPSSLTSLSGTTNTTWLSYAYNYTANKTNPLLIFGFDASISMYIVIDDISVVDVAFPSIQLLRNPSFENSSSNPIGWSQWCEDECSGSSEGSVEDDDCRTNRCYISNCIGGVEYLVQAFSATIGRIYTISFWSQRVRFSSTSNSVVTLYVGII